jgi:hypothetical protein
MEMNANIARNFLKKKKKNNRLVVDNFGGVFTWSVRISKYGNLHQDGQKIRKKSRMVLLFVNNIEGATFRVQSTFPNMESDALLNEKSQ